MSFVHSNIKLHYLYSALRYSLTHERDRIWFFTQCLAVPVWIYTVYTTLNFSSAPSVLHTLPTLPYFPLVCFQWVECFPPIPTILSPSHLGRSHLPMCCPVLPSETTTIFVRAAVTTYKRSSASGLLTCCHRRLWAGSVDLHFWSQPPFLPLPASSI